MSRLDKKLLSDVMYQYGTITVYSGNREIICPWEKDLLKYYADHKIEFMWLNPVDCHAYIHIR